MARYSKTALYKLRNDLRHEGHSNKPNHLLDHPGKKPIEPMGIPTPHFFQENFDGHPLEKDSQLDSAVKPSNKLTVKVSKSPLKPITKKKAATKKKASPPKKAKKTVQKKSAVKSAKKITKKLVAKKVSSRKNTSKFASAKSTKKITRKKPLAAKKLSKQKK